MSVPQETTTSDGASDCDEYGRYLITEEDAHIVINEFMKMADSMYREGHRSHRTMKNAFLKTEDCKVGGDVIMEVFLSCSDLVREEFKLGKRTM